MKIAFKYLFVPITLVAVFTLTMGLCRIVDGQYFVLVSVAVNLLIVVFFVLSEHFIPYKKDWLENKGDVKADAIQTFLVLPTASKISELVLPFLFYLFMILQNLKLRYIQENLCCTLLSL